MLIRLNPVTGFGPVALHCARRIHVAAVLLFIGAFLASGLSVQAQQSPQPEYKLKSIFLYNFAKFIQWPHSRFETPDAPLVVGIYGKNPFRDFVKDLEKQSVGKHKIVIEQVSSAGAARHCHVLFIGEAPKRAAKLIDQLKNANVLTVTDEIEGFQSVGAVINLITAANRTVHFEINVDAARRAELKINSSLLNLAKIVRDGSA
ncbi:MAG: YfiR family protein [Limisphaerales bacterium]